MTDKCIHCGRKTNPGSGLFANRVPVFGTLEEKMGDGFRYPEGEWICRECDAMRD